MHRIPIDKENYSDSSKRSVGHEFLEEYYSDVKYKCIKCKRHAVFTAQEQKEAYEVRKEYMWSIRVLCNTCWKERHSIKKELDEKESIYLQSKESAIKDKLFLKEWLTLLQEYPKYGKSENSARIRFINKALKNA